MFNKLHLFSLLFFTCLSVLGQADSRIQTIENKLELLKIEYPEFGEKVNVNLSNTSLSNFLLAISKVHGINIKVSPNLSSVTIVNNFSDVSVEDLLIFLAREYDLDIKFTGNIISVSNYHEPKQLPVEKEIIASYRPAENLISLDLNQDPLFKVLRKITDISGKNMVFAPGMENIPLTGYFSNVPFESAIEKLALANNLDVNQSRDGFFIFNRKNNSGNSYGENRIKSFSDNFHYTILDPYEQILEVDFRNVPASDIINTLSEDLNLNIFTASPLESMGTISIKSDFIKFDTLLQKIFESVNSQDNDVVRPENQPNNSSFRNNQASVETVRKVYTYKKAGNLYYFGTEDQLLLKKIEIVPMMYRSIEMLSNPAGSSRGRSTGSNFNTGTSNYIGGGNNFNQNNQGRNNGTQETSVLKAPTEAIQKLIPEDLQEGINIKIDSELNSFIVSGPAARIERFKRFIQDIDKPVPVILIEVMILEVSRTSVVETGVSFGLGDEPVTTKGQAFPSANMRIGANTVNRVIGGFDGFGSLNMGKVLPNFYADIKAMEANGSLKILSTPKLSTLNGHRAHLSSGETTYYAVTNQNFFGSQIPQTSETTNYYPIDAELALDIMPFVSGDGEITLDINVVQSSFNGERIAENAPPGMNSREFSSIIRMRDQDIAILGGIEERTKDDSGSGVPILARIPIIKWLFSERRREDSKKKLNILIKPTVIF